MSAKPAVETTATNGGRLVCACHGWSVRWITRRSGRRDLIHCEHPERYIDHGDGYIPDYCEACGWNTGR